MGNLILLYMMLIVIHHVRGFQISDFNTCKRIIGYFGALINTVHRTLIVEHYYAQY